MRLRTNTVALLVPKTGALRPAEVGAREFDAYLSANRTCEIGMQHATGRPYHSVLIELERATR
jgi:D-lactate dehydrogenase